ncbi:hypothetical protein N7466_006521 [Penicillium verhagenii]|uniref:uncharacterized protein n=1 Tax=Penicillium verhagenii TaxID=1562060 RepID=UPI0025451092|nr:uncharacterized protein N7466_006521 [Penicillium verhagenii]KAJ5931028.1 hypothetical protein N7466_006521 [Penicillium verhagenii]
MSSRIKRVQQVQHVQQVQQAQQAQQVKQVWENICALSQNVKHKTRISSSNLVFLHSFAKCATSDTQYAKRKTTTRLASSSGLKSLRSSQCHPLARSQVSGHQTYDYLNN